MVTGAKLVKQMESKLKKFQTAFSALGPEVSMRVATILTIVFFVLPSIAVAQSNNLRHVYAAVIEEMRTTKLEDGRIGVTIIAEVKHTYIGSEQKRITVTKPFRPAVTLQPGTPVVVAVPPEYPIDGGTSGGPPPTISGQSNLPVIIFYWWWTSSPGPAGRSPNPSPAPSPVPAVPAPVPAPIPGGGGADTGSPPDEQAQMYRDTLEDFAQTVPSMEYIAQELIARGESEEEVYQFLVARSLEIYQDCLEDFEAGSDDLNECLEAGADGLIFTVLPEGLPWPQPGGRQPNTRRIGVF